MRIRLSLTFDISRSTPNPGSAAESPHVDESNGALVERADRTPIGFAVLPTNPQDPFETGEDRR